MVRPLKRFTRKDIRQPDQFVTFTRRLFHLAEGHRYAFVASLALILVGALALWGWDSYRSRQNRLAAQHYSRAVSLYRDGKFREAIEALSDLNIYRSSPYSRFGLFYQANSHIALKEPARAIEALQELLRRERKDPLLRQLAFMALGTTQERAGQCGEAVPTFSQAEKISGPFKEEALLGKARCSVQNRDPNEALKSYRQYLTDYPASERITAISLQIQELETKVREAGPGK
ncbi:MAG: tetratricopeptide repeat protein [Candidatus Binatia bacterium]